MGAAEDVQDAAASREGFIEEVAPEPRLVGKVQVHQQ